MELKWYCRYFACSRRLGSNRTFMELKFDSMLLLKLASRSNRTFMELKYISFVKAA